MHGRWVRVGLLLQWLLSPVVCLAGWGGLVQDAIPGFVRKGSQATLLYPPGALINECSSPISCEEGSAKESMPFNGFEPEKINLHVVSIAPGTQDFTDVQLPRLLGGQQPKNLQGAVLANTPLASEYIQLKLQPKAQQVSFDWIDEFGEWVRDYILLIEDNNQETIGSRATFSGVRFPGVTEVELVIREAGKGEFEEKMTSLSRAAMEALLDKILDLLSGDLVELYYPGTNGYSIGGAVQGVAVISFQPRQTYTSGPTEEHWRNWLTVLGLNPRHSGKGKAGHKRRKAAKSLSQYELLRRYTRETAREVMAKMEKAGGEQAKFVQRVKRKELDTTSVFCLIQPPKNFSSPTLHWLFQELMQRLGEFEEDGTRTQTEVFQEIQKRDPLLFDTFSYLVYLALKSDVGVDEKSKEYIRSWIRYFEVFFSVAKERRPTYVNLGEEGWRNTIIWLMSVSWLGEGLAVKDDSQLSIPWREHFHDMRQPGRSFRRSSNINLFPRVSSVRSLPKEKPAEVESNVGWYALESFKRDLADSYPFWKELKDHLEQIRVNEGQSEGRISENSRFMDALVEPANRHADPLLIPFVRFVFNNYLQKYGYFSLYEQEAYYLLIDSVINNSKPFYETMNWEYWLKLSLPEMGEIKYEQEPLYEFDVLQVVVQEISQKSESVEMEDESGYVSENTIPPEAGIDIMDD